MAESETETEPEPRKEREVNLQVQALSKLASNPLALVAYAILAGGGAGYFGGGLEEDLDDHVHEENRLPELRRHWTADERRALEKRLEELEELVTKPQPVQLDEETRRRISALEVEVGAAIRLLELLRSSSPATEGSQP